MYSDEEVQKAREMDLLTYLQNYEPDNLKRISGNVYRTIDHDSLVISNGKGRDKSRVIIRPSLRAALLVL